MKRILVVANDTFSLYKFRLDLMKEFIRLGYEVVALGPDREYAEQIGAIGIRYYQISYERTGTNPFKDFRLLREYEHYITKLKPDKVFAYNSKPVLYGLWAAKRCGITQLYAMIPGAGYIFSNDDWKSNLIRIFISGLYRRSLSYARRVIFQNPDDKAEFCARKLVKPEQCVMVGGSGVNMEEYPFCKVPEKPVFIFIGRLLKVKGIMEFCEAARETRKRYSEARFMVLGETDANPTSIHRDLLDEYIQAGDIEYYGKQADVRPFVKEASVFVLPTYHREGVPHATLEAMSMGRAIITTTCIGARETVVDNVNGLLIPPRNAVALTQAMETLMNKGSDAIQKMGEASHRICQERFDVLAVNRVITKGLEM